MWNVTQACLFAALMVVAPAVSAFADEQPVELAEGPGKTVVENNCASCHSLDYIKMNSPFMTPNVWQAEVNKMVNTFGAPIDEEDAKLIVQYLVRHYGG